MKNSFAKNGAYGFDDSDEDILKELFAEYLIRVYCAKSHLAERLPELADQSKFTDLHPVIGHIIEDINRQLERIYDLFKLVDMPISMDNCDHVIFMMEDAFSLIHQRDSPFHRDIAILYYTQSVRDIEENAFQMLDLITSQMDNYHISLLIKENRQEAKKIMPLTQLLRERYPNRL
jgi:ferritin-like metal-binding protein YciE